MDMNFSNSNFTYSSPSPNVELETYVESECKNITIGSKLTYTIILKNFSEYNLESVYMVVDIINGLRYKRESLRINGRTPFGGDIDLNKEAVITIGYLQRNSKLTVLFDVIIEDVPVQYPILSYTRAVYSYYQERKLISRIETSNKVSTYFDIQSNKSKIIQSIEGKQISNKQLDDEVKINIVINPIDMIKDTTIDNCLDKNLQFISASIKYNNIQRKDLYIQNNSLYIGTIDGLDRVEITITARIIDYKTIERAFIKNEPIIKYYVDGHNKFMYSSPNPVYIYIKYAKIDSCTSIDKDYVNVGDEVNFLIKLKHNGPVPVEDVIIENVFPSYLDYIDESATILYEGLSNCSFRYDKTENKINIPILDLNEEVIISLRATIRPCPKNSNIINDIYLNYKYLKYIEPENYTNIYKYIENEIIYKECKTHRCEANLLETLKKDIVSNCDCNTNKIDYLVSFTNTGQLTAYNVLIEDVLSGASFDKSSLKVYTDSPNGHKDYCGNLPKISINQVCPGETIKMFFTANIIKNTSSKKVTNYVNLYYQYYEYDCKNPVKSHGRSNMVSVDIEDKIDNLFTINNETSYQAEVNSEINNKIYIKNISSTDLYNVYYKLNFTSGYENYIKYKENSLNIIGGTPPSKNINPNTDPIEIGTIKANEVVIIEFIEIALNKTTNPLSIYATGYYSYEKCGCPKLIDCKDETNEVFLEIIEPVASIDKQAYSYCSPDEIGCIPQPITTAGVGDRITYKITITNNSTYTLENVLLNDVLSSNVEYVPDSLKINSKPVSYDLENNLPLPNIYPKTSIVVSFDVIIKSLPTNSRLINTACIKYDYLIDPNKCIRKRGELCDSNIINILYADLTQGATKISNPKIISRNDPANNTGTYTVTLKNTGNIDAINVKFIDKLPQGLIFISNSVVVKGVDQSGNTVKLEVDSIPPGEPLNVENGIVIDKISPQVTVTIQYGYKVTIDSPDTIINTGTFDYSFIAGGNVVNKPNNSTSTDTMIVIDDILDINQIASPTIVCPSDIIVYSIEVENLSSDKIDNIILQSTVPSNTVLVPSSFTVNLKPITPPVTESDLEKGINIGTINKAPDNSKFIQYQLKVIDSSIDPIINKVNAYYKNADKISKIYTSITTVDISNDCPDPCPTRIVDIKKEAYSYCNPSSISCTVHPVTIASIGDTITYQIPVKNVSKLLLKDVVFNDNLPIGVEYIENSLKIDGITVPSGLIPDLKLGNLEPNESSIVTFDVKVVSIPNSKNIINTSCVTYKYKEDCPGCSEKEETDCASNKFEVVSPDLTSSFVKYVDEIGITENYKNQDDSISYIIQFTNTGNSDATNVILIDTIPNEVGYLLDTVVVTPSVPAQNITQPTSESEVLKIKFDTIPKGASYTIEFDTALSTTVVFGDVYNRAQLDYSYKSFSTGNIITTSVLSNTVVSHVNSANLEITKAASASEVDINVPVTYTINIKNNGNVNANNVYVKDLLPNVVEYVPNTLKVNGLPSSSDINGGILIGTIPPNGFATIEFQVVAKYAPEINPISNTADASYTYVSNPDTGKEENGFASSNQVFLLIKAADLISVTPKKESDTFIVSRNDPANNSGNYILTLYNSGNIDALDVKVADTLPQGLTFVPGSVIVTGKDNSGNNIPLAVNSIPPGEALNIENGIILDKIPPYVTVTIKYGYTANSDAAELIDNIAAFDYSYIVNQNVVKKPNNQTNKATIATVDNALNITKDVIPTTICPGQTLLYTIEIENRISNSINNIILQDTIPSGTSLVPKTFTLNFKEFTIEGNPINELSLAQGINIGSITAGSKDIVQFLVSVSTTNTISPIVNIANVSYTNGTIPSNIFSSTAVATVPANCPNPCPNTCPNPCPNPCPCQCVHSCNMCCNTKCTHYGKSSCRPGKRLACKQMNTQINKNNSYYR